jgi:hypothetical protein
VEIDYYTGGKGNSKFKAGRKETTGKKQIPDKGNLELLRASKKQRRVERKIKIVQERKEKAYNGELKRLKQATDSNGINNGSLDSNGINKEGSLGSNGISKGSLDSNGIDKGSLDSNGIGKAHSARMTLTKAHSTPMA